MIAYEFVILISRFIFLSIFLISFFHSLKIYVEFVTSCGMGMVWIFLLKMRRKTNFISDNGTWGKERLICLHFISLPFLNIGLCYNYRYLPQMKETR